MSNTEIIKGEKRLPLTRDLLFWSSLGLCLKSELRANNKRLVPYFQTWENSLLMHADCSFSRRQKQEMRSDHSEFMSVYFHASYQLASHWTCLHQNKWWTMKGSGFAHQGWRGQDLFPLTKLRYEKSQMSGQTDRINSNVMLLRYM